MAKTSWEKLQKFDKVIQVIHEYRRLLQLFIWADVFAQLPA